MIRAFIQSIVDINILFRKHDNEDDLLSLIERFPSVKVVVLGPSVTEQRPLQQSCSLTVHMSFLQTGISLEFVYHDYTWISSSLSYRGIKRDDVDLSFITALSTPPPSWSPHHMTPNTSLLSPYCLRMTLLVFVRYIFVNYRKHKDICLV